jgi:hypothetical protein
MASVEFKIELMVGSKLLWWYFSVKVLFQFQFNSFFKFVHWMKLWKLERVLTKKQHLLCIKIEVVKSLDVFWMFAWAGEQT